MYFRFLFRYSACIGYTETPGAQVPPITIDPGEPMKAVINLLLITLLTGCHTIYPWDREGPKAASELHTDQEKKSEYDTFAIAQITPNTCLLYTSDAADE